LVPGGCIAHVLHQAGIPFVLASQVPLSKEGSELLVGEFYGGLLWGEHPSALMHRVRRTLHGLLGASTHDWASLVVYEALPPDLPSQLEEARHRQAAAANNVSLERIDSALHDSKGYVEATSALFKTLQRLPTEGRFAMEGLGLRASSFKRLAQAEFKIAEQSGCESPMKHALESANYLNEALYHYEQAVSGFLVDTGKPVQRLASLHWVLVQQLCLSAVLRKEAPDGAEATARMSARAYLEHPDLREQAWARGSLAELELLALLRASSDKSQESMIQKLKTQAQTHVRELVRLARRLNYPFLVDSTFRQFRRYVDWWGTTRLRDVVCGQHVDEPSWAANGFISIAEELAQLLGENSAQQEVRPPSRTGDVATSSGRENSEPAPARVPPKGKPTAAQALLRRDSAPAATAGKSTRVNDEGERSHISKKEGPFIDLEMLPAGHGDCLWIEYGEGSKISRVLVDCGPPETFEPQLKPRIERQPQGERQFELFVMTHIDADHIGGGIPFIEAAKGLEVTFGDVWFNGWGQIKDYGFLGAKQGEIFSALLVKDGWPWNQWRDGHAIVLEGDGLPTCTLPGGMVLTLLSPTADKLKKLALKWKKEIKALGLEPGEGDKMLARTTVSTSTDVPALAKKPFKPDTAENNGSSITLLAEYGGKSILLGADCHAPLLATSIKTLLKQRGLPKLKIDAFKVPHHGSQNNLDETVMRQIDCRNYLISTNGAVFKHPDREAIARIIYFGGESPRLYFNYRSDLNEVWARSDLQKKYGYTAVYPEPTKPGLSVALGGDA
jgi:beta-lactamase superfamily II metal-dependent hydrolase